MTSTETVIATQVATIGQCLNELKRLLPATPRSAFKSNTLTVLNNHCNELVDILADNGAANLPINQIR